MKKNLEWFKHETGSRSHWKFKALRHVYKEKLKENGWAGEAKFWVLNCIIAEAEGCFLDLSSTHKMKAIAAELELTIDDFHVFLDILINDVELVKKNAQELLYTDHTQQSILNAEEYREYHRLRKQEKRKSSQTAKKATKRSLFSTVDNPDVHMDNSSVNMESPEIHVEKQHSRVEKSRVEKSRVEYIDSLSADADSEKEKKDVVGVVENGVKGAADFVKKKGARPRKKKVESDPDKELFNHIKNSWMVWFKSRGNPSPKFEGPQAKATSNLRTYFLRLARDSGCDDEHTSAGLLFDDVLNNWEKLKANNFLYSAVDIMMISSKINEIINFQNNGQQRGNKKSGGTSGKSIYDSI